MKFLRWIWFVCGCIGFSILVSHCWHRLNCLDAVLVSGLSLLGVLEWLGSTLAYQWDLPKETW